MTLTFNPCSTGHSIKTRKKPDGLHWYCGRPGCDWHVITKLPGGANG